MTTTAVLTQLIAKPAHRLWWAISKETGAMATKRASAPTTVAAAMTRRDRALDKAEINWVDAKNSDASAVGLGTINQEQFNKRGDRAVTIRDTAKAKAKEDYDTAYKRITAAAERKAATKTAAAEKKAEAKATAAAKKAESKATAAPRKSSRRRRLVAYAKRIQLIGR